MEAVELIRPAAPPSFAWRLPSALRHYGSSLLLLILWEAICRAGWVTPQSSPPPPASWPPWPS